MDDTSKLDWGKFDATSHRSGDYLCFRSYYHFGPFTCDPGTQQTKCEHCKSENVSIVLVSGEYTELIEMVKEGKKHICNFRETRDRAWGESICNNCGGISHPELVVRCWCGKIRPGEIARSIDSISFNE